MIAISCESNEFYCEPCCMYLRKLAMLLLCKHERWHLGNFSSFRHHASEHIVISKNARSLEQSDDPLRYAERLEILSQRNGK